MSVRTVGSKKNVFSIEPLLPSGKIYGRPSALSLSPALSKVLSPSSVADNGPRSKRKYKEFNFQRFHCFHKFPLEKFVSNAPVDDGSVSAAMRPLLMILACTAVSIALSGLVLGVAIKGSLPPSSSTVFLICLPAVSATLLPRSYASGQRDCSNARVCNKIRVRAFSR